MLHVQIEHVNQRVIANKLNYIFYITNHCIDVNICVHVYFVYTFNKISKNIQHHCVFQKYEYYMYIHIVSGS